MNQTTTEILASRVTPEGAALLLMLARWQEPEEPNVSEPRIERVPGWTDQMIEKCEQLQAENKLLLEAVKNPVQAKGWRYPKPGDKLRVLKVPSGSPDWLNVRMEIQASDPCETTHYDQPSQKSSYAVTCSSLDATSYVVIPLDCVEPA